MTNPFANNPGVATATPAAQPFNGQQQFNPAQQQPASNGFGGQQFADPPSTRPEPAKPAGDPFADAGGRSGDKVSDLLGRLLLIRPLEIIASMTTEAGTTENVVRANVAILDDPNQPGRVAPSMLFFQKALREELGDTFRDPAQALLIGRLTRGQAKGNKSAPFLFAKTTDEEKNLARQFLRSDMASAL